LEHAGTTQKVEVCSKNDDKFYVECAGENKAHLTLKQIINLLNKETEDGYLGTFKKILNHRLTKK